ncbi:MAG: glycosyltransferase family 4 protein [Candidatus Dormibacteria bacterium]
MRGTGGSIVTTVPSGRALRGSFDDPADPILTRTLQRFSGWCLEGRDVPQRLELTLSGTARIDAEVGSQRLDVPLNLGQPEVTPACGWEAWVDFSDWPPGELTVVARAFGHSGDSAILGTRGFSLVGTRLVGALDAPRAGAELKDELLAVRGWAVIDGEPAARVEVSIDGRLLGRARLCVPSIGMAPPLVRRFGSLAGFEFRDALPPGDGDSVGVTVDVTSRRGHREVLASRTVRRAKSVVAEDEREVATRLLERTERLIRRSRPARRGARPSLLVFTHSLTIGGGQLYLNDLLTCLAPHLGRCTVVSPVDGVLRKDLDALGMDVVVTGSVLDAHLERYEGDVRDLCFFIQATDPDIVLANTLGCFRAVDAAVRLGLPTIWSIHESFALDDWLGLSLGDGCCHPYVRERLQASLAGATKLVFEAAATRDLVVSGIDAAQTAVVPYGVDIDSIDHYAASFDRTAARAEHDLAPDDVIVLAVGVVEARKGQGPLIQAFIEVASVHERAVLVVVGDHPCELSRTFHDLIDRSGVRDRVRLVPITEDIWEWYAMSDVLVTAADIESLPRTMLEAMGFGLPVLSTDVFGVPDVIDDGVNGWLFPARDWDGLLAGLHRVLRMSRENRLAVGEAGRETARRDHRREGYGEAYRKMIDQLAGVTPRA